MGVGHVPPGPLREASQGHDLPGREHRGAGADLIDLSVGRRRWLGHLGETVALRVLCDHGATLLARNIAVTRGEIDLQVAFGDLVVAVEVKTLLRSGHRNPDPLRSYTVDKADQVHRLARRLRPRPQRVDVVAVVVDPRGVDVRWVRCA